MEHLPWNFKKTLDSEEKHLGYLSILGHEMDLNVANCGYLRSSGASCKLWNTRMGCPFAHMTATWVVARLGGCFPQKVISKTLQYDLKAFSGNFNKTLDSEGKLLGYLSMGLERDLNVALWEMFEVVLYPEKGKKSPNLHTIIYFIHLSRMSEILLQPNINVFLDIFNESLIPSLVYLRACT